MSKISKIVLILVVFFVVLIAGLLIYIKTVIDVDYLRTEITRVLDQQLVGTKSKLKTVSYSLGATVDFTIVGLQITDLEKDLVVFQNQEAHVEISLISFLMGEGGMELVLESPELIIFKTKNNEINWVSYTKSEDSKNPNTKKIDKQVEDKSFEVPKFIEKSKLHLRVSDMKLSYRDKTTTELTIEKLLLKNLSLDKTTAYEVISGFSIPLSDTEQLSAKLALVGEVSLQNLIGEQSFSGKTFLKLSDINYSAANYKLPVLEGSITYTIAGNSDLGLGISLEGESFLSMISQIDLKADSLAASITKLQLNLSEVPNRFNLPLEDFSFRNSQFTANGDVSLNTNTDTINENLSFGLTNPISMQLKGERFQIGLNGSLEGKKLMMNVPLEAMGGSGSLEVKSNIDLNGLPKEVSQIPLINLDLNLKGIKVSESFIKSLESPEARPAQKTSDVPRGESAEAQALAASKKPIELPKISGSVTVADSELFNHPMNLTSRFYMENKSFKTPKTTIKLGKSVSSLSANANLNEPMVVNLDLDAQNFDVDYVRPLLPLQLKELTMPLSLSAKGRVTMSTPLAYDIAVALDSKDGELKGLQLKEILASFLGKLAKYLPKKKEIALSDKYDRLTINGKLTDTKANFSRLYFLGNNRNPSLELQGHLSMEGKNSSLVGEIGLSTIKEDLQKEFGVSTLPIRLEGDGFNVLPEFSYTSKKLIKKATKQRVEKYKEKAKEKVKDKLQEKAKKLLKGFKL